MLGPISFPVGPMEDHTRARVNARLTVALAPPAAVPLRTRSLPSAASVRRVPPVGSIFSVLAATGTCRSSRRKRRPHPPDQPGLPFLPNARTVRSPPLTDGLGPLSSSSRSTRSATLFIVSIKPGGRAPDAANSVQGPSPSLAQRIPNSARYFGV